MSLKSRISEHFSSEDNPLVSSTAINDANIPERKQAKVIPPLQVRALNDSEMDWFKKIHQKWMKIQNKKQYN